MKKNIITNNSVPCKSITVKSAHRQDMSGNYKHIYILILFNSAYFLCKFVILRNLCLLPEAI
jgi:hypothetical protein